MSASAAPRKLFSYRKFWAHRYGPAPFLPMSRAEMTALGWDSCDIIIVTGDAYVDHPSFGMAVIGRVLEAQGFRVGIIAQPDWTSAEAFRALGRPNLFFGVAAGNMDSMVNRYTSDRRIRSNDAYTPNDEGGRRPDRAVIVYAQRCREVTGCDRLMIGRGLVSDPGLALAIAQSAPGVRVVPWSVIRSLMPGFWQNVCSRVASRHRAGRLKQWLNYLRRTYPEAQAAFDELRLVHDPLRIQAWMAQPL